VSNKRCPGLELWEKTARLNNLNPVILGLDDKRELGHESQKFGLKFILLANYLRTLPPADLCLVTDGFDVIFHNAQNLEERLRPLPAHQLLFAADVFENPDQGNPYKTKFFRAPYLNSGVYAGRASTILNVLAGAFETNEQDTMRLDDQRYYVEYMFRNPGVILIDHACHHFACTAGLEYHQDFSVQSVNSVPTLTVLGNTPCVLHFQGFYKDTRIVRELYHNEEIKTLARKIMRMPSPWGKAVGDALVRLGSKVPVEKSYQVHAGVCIALLLALGLFLSVKSFVM